jgi:outer membrane protein assembly factor BamA
MLGNSRSAGETPLPLDTAVVSSPFDQRRFALRGYDSGLPGLTGRRMYTAAAEWRFPIARTERGFMAPPVGLQQLYGTLFAEAGDAWNDGRHPDDIASGAGAEAHANVPLFYELLLHLRLGYAYGFADSGGSQAYLQLGASF